MIGSADNLQSLRDREPRYKPVIAVTMGDPGGIGPEVVVKALADPDIRSLGRFIIYGMDEAVDAAAGLAEIDPFWFAIPSDRVVGVKSGVLLADYDEFSYGTMIRQESAVGGESSLAFLEDAIDAARTGLVDAIVTGPINKTSWKKAGCKFDGHTELLQERFKVKRVTMMFSGGPLKVALASRHIGLFQLRNQFNIGAVFHPIDALNDALKRYWGIASPRIAVAGLNPHAGENGQFGDEETRVIEPAIDMARQAGITVEGPFPADTLFHKLVNGPHAFDGVLAMYHDQGLIPVKLVAFDRAVNITLGLPTIRTSVDHGTAFDIAGKDKANAGSMKEAIKLACEMAVARSMSQPNAAAQHIQSPT